MRQKSLPPRDYANLRRTHIVRTKIYKGADDMQKKNNLQEIFLTQARKQNVPVTMFLMNGFQLRRR